MNSGPNKITFLETSLGWPFMEALLQSGRFVPSRTIQTSQPSNENVLATAMTASGAPSDVWTYWKPTRLASMAIAGFNRSKHLFSPHVSSRHYFRRPWRTLRTLFRGRGVFRHKKSRQPAIPIFSRCPTVVLTYSNSTHNGAIQAVEIASVSVSSPGWNISFWLSAVKGVPMSTCVHFLLYQSWTDLEMSFNSQFSFEQKQFFWDVLKFQRKVIKAVSTK